MCSSTLLRVIRLNLLAVEIFSIKPFEALILSFFLINLILFLSGSIVCNFQILFFLFTDIKKDQIQHQHQE